MLEAYLTTLWKPTDERALPSPTEKDRTCSIIYELQRELDSENAVIELISNVLAKHQRRARILEEELQKRKLYIAPIRKVPDDVLVEIINIARRGDPWEIWRFSHVCRRWRQLCHSYPWLWSHIEVDLSVDRPYVGLVQIWRTRAWATKQTIVLRLHLSQFGALREMLKGGLKYITHLRLSIPAATIAPPQFELPPALPCLRHLALINGDGHYPLNYIEAKGYITSLCHRLFTRRQTRRRASVARFHLEFHNLAFNDFHRVMNRVQTVVFSECTFTGPSQIFQFLEAATSTLKHLKYTNCWVESSELLSHIRPLTFPLLLTLTHSAATSSHQFPILSILSCPTLTTLIVNTTEVALCTVARYPALKELSVTGLFCDHGKHTYAPFVKDFRQLETLTICITNAYFSVSSTSASHLLRYFNPDTYTPSLRRIRLHFHMIHGVVEELDFVCQAAAGAFATHGRDLEFVLVNQVSRTIEYSSGLCLV